MYWRHFDLSAEPFSLTPDPAFLYLSSVHAEAFAALSVGLRERRGLIAMIGEVGTGKTTLVYSLLSGLGPEIHTAYISNARLSFDGILRSALRDFGVDCPGVHVSELLDAFNRFLHRCAEDGTTAALVIDEAQNLSRDTFEDLRLLTNFETYKHKLLQIVLVGQPELDSKLRDPSLRQVADRIAVRCHVNPLTPQEVRQYLQHRLAAAGGSLDIFSEAALRILVRRSRGIPRSINILGHNAMLFAYGAGRKRVGRRDATAAIREREGRGLVRFEHLPSWMSGLFGREGTRSLRLRYSGLILVGVLASLLFFALRPAARESSTSATAPAPAEKSDVPRADATARKRESPDASSRAERKTIRERKVELPPTRPAEVEDVDSEDGAANDPAPGRAFEDQRPQARPDERLASAAPMVPLSAPRASEPKADTAPQKTITPPAIAAPETQKTSALPSVAAPSSQRTLTPPALIAGPSQEPAPLVVAAPQPPKPSPAAPAAHASEQQANAAETAPAPAAPTPAPPASQAATSSPAPVRSAAVSKPERVSAPPSRAVPKEPSRSSAAPSSGTKPAAAAATSAPATSVVAITQPRGDVRMVPVSPGSSLYDLITAIYGEYDPRYVPRIQAMNPQVKDPDYIFAGDKLRFPEQIQGGARDER